MIADETKTTPCDVLLQVLILCVPLDVTNQSLTAKFHFKVGDWLLSAVALI